MLLENLSNKNNKLFVLVGLPGSGKSTWTKRVLSETNKPYIVVSSDKHIEEYARSKNKTYSDVFDEYVKTAGKLMNDEAERAISERVNVIWDQTNLSAKKRKAILRRFPNSYYKVVIIFDIDDEELGNRLKKRGEEEGKNIPNFVLNNMRKGYQHPSLTEGFDKIIEA